MLKFMAMDHIYTYLGGALNGGVPIWFGYLGKLAAPIFFYLIIEGFYHTRSRVKYMQRIFGMGFVMVGVDLFLGIHNNSFLSLGLGLAMMFSIEYAKAHEKASKGSYLEYQLQFYLEVYQYLLRHQFMDL